MSLRPEPLSPIPDVTTAAVRAAFPKGNLYVNCALSSARSMRINFLPISIPLRGVLWKLPPGAWRWLW